MQPDAFADAVVTLVKNALGPVLERLAATEARLAVLGDVRDRLVIVETKAAQPVALAPVEPPAPVDLSPLLERLAVSEARLSAVGDVRDRVVTLETKAAQPVPEHPVVDLGPLQTALAELAKDQAVLRERVAVAEVRQLVPGPAGRDGANGKDGERGSDGLGCDDLTVTQVDERTFTVAAVRGTDVKTIGTVTFPVEIYRGVYIEGKTYDRGDGVTWGGSEWHANETTTTRPGDGSKAWTLKVKRGRDGKDGRDAIPAPVVSIGGPR